MLKEEYSLDIFRKILEVCKSQDKYICRPTGKIRTPYAGVATHF